MNAPAAPPNRHASDLSSSVTGTGKRQQHKLATLNALRQAALDLALTHGLDTITVGDIAKRSAVSRRTFFNYFASKEDAVVGETPELVGMVHTTIVERPDSEQPLVAVRNALVELAATIVTPQMRQRIRNRHQLLTAHPELLGRHLARYAAFENLLREAISDRGSEDPDLLATVVTSTLRLCVQRWATDDGVDLVHHLEQSLSAIHNGLR